MSKRSIAAAKKVLSKTRGLFVATHWTTGHMSRFDEAANKTFYCAVGGLRYIAVGDPETIDGSLYDTPEYRDALAALVLEIQDDADTREMIALVNDDETPVSSRRDALSVLETIVVEWNDDHDAVDDILETFDSALAHME